jgi:comEA protein
MAAATATALVLMAVYAWSAGMWSGRLVEIDTALPLTAQYLVNLNQASWVEIAQLPGIGETLARRIIAWREEHGAIATLEDLKHVKGMGPKTIAAIEPYITFGDAAPTSAEASAAPIADAQPSSLDSTSAP